jgi:SAM-dependent methyltransferase
LTKTHTPLSVPVSLRRGGLKNDEQKSVESGRLLIELMCEAFGVADLGDARLLDMGCGVKLTQAFLAEKLPIREYAGVDVYGEMIDYLREHVHDERFNFHTINTHNALYNPGGEPLSESTVLPVEEGDFDFICLFSVFTHLAPADFSAMLRVLRRYISPGGKMIFSAFLNETSTGGHGFIDRFTAQLVNQGIELTAEGENRGFVDFDEKHPLKIALYTREYALELFEGSGWEIESINEPREYIQHYFVCHPI